MSASHLWGLTGHVCLPGYTHPASGLLDQHVLSGHRWGSHSGTTEEGLSQCWTSGTLFRLLTPTAPEASHREGGRRRWPLADVCVFVGCLCGQDTPHTVPLQRAARAGWILACLALLDRHVSILAGTRRGKPASQPSSFFWTVSGGLLGLGILEDSRGLVGNAYTHTLWWSHAWV